MAVLVECSLPPDQFHLGSAFAREGHAGVELLHVVPTDAATAAYVQITSRDFDDIDAALDACDRVTAFERVDRVGDQALYRVEWRSDGGLLDGVVETSARLKEATGNGRWTFWLQFRDHDRLAQFYNYCTEHDLGLTFERVLTLPDDAGDALSYGLTPEQRETLVLALRHGYFAVPSETSTSELASELGVSQQAVSQRIRRGVEKVLRTTLVEGEE